MATHSSVLAWRIPGTGEPGLSNLTEYPKPSLREEGQRERAAALQMEISHINVNVSYKRITTTWFS